MLEVLDHLGTGARSNNGGAGQLQSASKAAVGLITDDDFVLDMTVVESTTPLVTLMCSTSDGCGSSCSTSACTTKASEPL